MGPDPACGHHSDPTPASGFPLRPLGFHPEHTPFAVSRQRWETAYARIAIASDTLAVVAVCTVGALIEARTADVVLVAAHAVLSATAMLLAAHLVRAWDPTVLGDGGAEYRRLVRGFAAAATVLAVVAYAAGLDDVRPWVFVAMPLSCVAAVAGRFGLRKALHRRRAAGACTRNVLAVGGVEVVADLIARTRRDHHRGWTVTAACTPTGTGSVLGVPVVGDLDAVATTARRGQHRIVSIGPAPGLSSVRLHRLAWDIEEVGADLVVDPRLTEVAGPRLHSEPVDGLPLLHLTRPTLDGVSLLVKSTIDRVAAAVLLVLVSPLLLGLFVAIRSGGGRAWQRETRIGRDGSPFTLLRFRSVVTDPEPRVTTVGSWMRRYALDELPQLFNVLGGSMSLVGPRPPLPEETIAAADASRRTFPIRPGLTGLWQVSGERNLSWEERARLDLRYVANWSLMQDAVILWKTVGAVVRAGDTC